MPTFEQIYAAHAAEYDALIDAEDAGGAVRAQLWAIVPGLAAASVGTAVDLGAGTGRVAALVAPAAARVIACDASAHMLSAAGPRIAAHAPHTPAHLVVADNARLPLPDGCADLVTEGWSFGHVTAWHAAHWQAHAQAAIDEMLRICAPGGYVVLFETMGTGTPSAAPPTPGLAALYAWMTGTYGFEHTVIATDYVFASAEQAATVCGFFFGDWLATSITEYDWATVPEWTGVWWKRKGQGDDRET
jgi:SAM-dependent methyltransferase